MQSHTQRLQMTARSLILQRQSKNDHDISFCWNVDHSIVWQLTWGGRENQNSLWMVPNLLYSLERHLKHITLMQLNEWWKAVLRAGCPRVCNSTVKYVLCCVTEGVRVVGKARLCVCVPVAFWVSHYPLTSSRSTGHHLSPARWPPTCRQAPPASSFSTSILSFLPSLFSQSIPITKIMTTSFTSESLADLIYCTLWECWSHLINANIIQIPM